jgi:hypothetical protein
VSSAAHVDGVVDRRRLGASNRGNCVAGFAAPTRVKRTNADVITGLVPVISINRERAMPSVFC